MHGGGWSSREGMWEMLLWSQFTRRKGQLLLTVGMAYIYGLTSARECLNPSILQGEVYWHVLIRTIHSFSMQIATLGYLPCQCSINHLHVQGYKWHRYNVPKNHAQQGRRGEGKWKVQTTFKKVKWRGNQWTSFDSVTGSTWWNRTEK